MKTMNGITNELLVKKARKNWRTRCGAFLLAALATFYGSSGQEAYGQATLTTNANWGANVAIDTVQTFNRVAPFGANIGAAAGYQIDRNAAKAVDWSIATNHLYGLDLADVVNGNVQAYLLDSTVAATPVRVANPYTFLASDAFASKGETFTIGQDMTWTGNFDVTGGTFNTQGRTLTVTSANFINNGRFTINNGTGGNGGFLVATNGNNNGTITIGSGGFRVASNNFSNATGTIDIGKNGMLALASSNFSGNVHGDFDITTPSRGNILLENSGTVRYGAGSWSGNIGVAGGAGGSVTPGVFGAHTLDVRGINSIGLDSLTVHYGASVVISSQSNIQALADIHLQTNGSISQHRDANVLTLANNISFNGQGNFDVYGPIGTQSYDADYVIDASRRMILTGNISSDFTYNKTFNVNANGGAGAVSLQGDGSGYHGDYYIHYGALEVDTGERLGPHGDPTQGRDYQIGIGDGAFRVINRTDQEIKRYISLDSAFSTYEVFTGDIKDVNGLVSSRHTMSDANRLTVTQSGAIYGAGSLNKAGDGRLVLAAAANSYQGDTIITHGILSISNSNQINDTDATRNIIIGSADNDTDYFRPVFETTTSADPAKYAQAGTVTINKAKVEINQKNSVIRTTGLNNETIINTEIISNVPSALTAPPKLNKEGAGTLTLKGQGNWGYGRTGETVIRQGTLQFFNKTNLATGDITIGTNPNTFKDLEGLPMNYEATLKLADNSGFQDLPNNIIIGGNVGASIDVGAGSQLGVNQVSEITGNQSDLNKKGQGELILKGTSSYTGWTNIKEGSVTLTKTDQISASEGVDLIGNNTKLTLEADQTIKNLRGLDATQSALAKSEWNPKLWTRTVDIDSNKLTVNTTIADKSADADKVTGFGNTLYGNIVSNGGTLVKGGVINSTLASGFLGYTGAFQIDAGNITTLSDTTITGLSGKAKTMLDVYGKTLTVDIGSNQQYDGTIVSRWALPANPKQSDYGRLIKTGSGTLTTNFIVYDTANIPFQSFNGSVELREGGIKSNSDFTMAKGNDMTFYANANANGSITPLVFDISGHTANFKAPTNLNVFLNNATTGWANPNGSTVVGAIYGNDNSDYTGLKPTEFNSLFYGVGTKEVTSVGRRDLHVLMNVTGFAGVGGTINEEAVGQNLDGIRLTDLTSNPNMAEIIKRLWAAGSNLSTAAERNAAAEKIRGVYNQLSADVIANATFMGLDSPWKRPFDRLNLDSQMVYVQPQRQYRGQMIANMRNIWFTPTYQGVSARSDGNGTGFNIERPGYQLGWDKRVAQNASVGFMLGYSSPSLHQDNDIVDASDFQFGLYGGAMVGYYIEVKGYIGFGHQNYKSSRTVDLRSIGLTSQSGHATFDGDTFNFSLEVARPLFLGFAVLRPTLGLDSEHAFRYAFEETGDSIAMKFDRSSISRTRARFALALETCTLERAIFSGRLGYSALLGGYDYAETSAQFVNVYAPAQTVRSVAVGKSYFDAGVGCRYFLNQSKTLSLVGDYDASVASHWAEHRGVVGFQYIY